MYVESFKNNGIDYLRLVKSIRVLNSKGIKTARKKVVYNIGPLSKFDDGKPEYVKRLKKSFKAGKPIISSLEKFCDKENLPVVHRFNILEGSPDCFGNPKIFSNILLERILEEIGLRNLFSSYKGFTKIKYDVYGFAKLLIFGRLLNPTSKSSTIKQNDNYYVPILNNFTRTMEYATATINSPNILAFGLNPFVFFKTNFLKSSINPIKPNPTATPINGINAVAIFA